MPYMLLGAGGELEGGGGCWEYGDGFWLGGLPAFPPAHGEAYEAFFGAGEAACSPMEFSRLGGRRRWGSSGGRGGPLGRPGGTAR